MTAPAPQPIDQGQALFDSRRTQCRNVMDRIDDAESRITKLKASIEDKKNRVYLQQSYRDKCQQFIQLQTEYRKLLHQNRVEPHPALEVGATNQGKILETSTTIAIKAVVDKLRNISERGILEGADPQPGDLADLHRLLENALQTAPPYIFLKSLDALVRLAAAKIKAQADELRNMQHENDADGRREAVQALLQQFREQHVAKFVETERLTNESAEVKKKAGKVLAEIDARLEEQFPKDPVQRQLNRSAMIVKAEERSAHARCDSLVRFAAELKQKRDELKPREGELRLLNERIRAATAILNEKQDLAQRLARDIKASRTKILAESHEVSEFVQTQLLPLRAELQDLLGRLSGFVAREHEAFTKMELSRAMYTSVEGMPRMPITQTALYRIEHDPFLRRMTDALRCPSYLAPEEVVLTLADLKTQVSEIEQAHQQNAELLDRARGDLVLLADHWVSRIGGGAVGERDTTAEGIGKTLITASVALQDRAAREQKLFLGKHLTRLQQRLQQADEVDAVDADIRRILAERDEILSGALVSDHKVKGRTFQQYIQYLDKRSGSM